MLRLRRKEDLETFIDTYATEHVAGLQPWIAHMTRQRVWNDLSLPLRAKLLGLILGDGTVSKSQVCVGLQVMMSRQDQHCFHCAHMHVPTVDIVCRQARRQTSACAAVAMTLVQHMTLPICLCIDCRLATGRR
jgi:hypothetical protein